MRKGEGGIGVSGKTKNIIEPNINDEICHKEIPNPFVKFEIIKIPVSHKTITYPSIRSDF